MPPKKAAAAAGKPPAGDALSDKVYARCAQDANKIWSQDDLFRLKLIPNNDMTVLLDVLGKLTSQGLFKTYTTDGILGWQVVKKEQAAKYVSYQSSFIPMVLTGTSTADMILFRHSLDTAPSPQTSR